MACVSIPAIAAVASAGVGAASAAGAFSPGTPAQPNVGAMTADQLNALIAATPANYASQAKYNPLFAALQSSIAWQNLFGTPATSATAAQTGWYDQNGQYLGPASAYSTTPTYTQVPVQGNRYGATQTVTVAPANPPPTGARMVNQGAIIPGAPSTPGAPGALATAAAAQPVLMGLQRLQRAGDISDVQTLGPAAYSAMAGYNPAVTGLYNSMTGQAQALVDQNGALDPFTTRALQQSFRSGEAARGMAGGTQDAAMEAYYLGSTQEQRRLTNLNLAGTVAGQTGSYFGDPFQQVLARTSGGVQVPGMQYTANQPSATANTAALLNPGLTDAQLGGYQASIGAQNAGYLARQGGISSLVSSIPTAVNGLYNYFSSPSSAPPVAPWSVTAGGTVNDWSVVPGQQ